MKAPSGNILPWIQSRRWRYLEEDTERSDNIKMNRKSISFHSGSQEIHCCSYCSNEKFQNDSYCLEISGKYWIDKEYDDFTTGVSRKLSQNDGNSFLANALILVKINSRTL